LPHESPILRDRNFDFNSCNPSYNLSMKPKGLYHNINKKRERIAAGSGEKMRKVGSKGAPTAKAFKQSAKTAKKK